MRNFMLPPVSKAASKPRYDDTRRGDSTKLLVLGDAGAVFSHFGKLGDFLGPHDLLVVNSSATIPASLPATLLRTGEALELRLAARGKDFAHWVAISFGSGDWRMPTEERGKAPELAMGDTLRIGPGLHAIVKKVEHRRLLQIELQGENVLSLLYRYGSVVQYAYHEKALPLWSMQTIIGSTPLSVEPPSALFPLTTERLLELGKKGVKVVSLLHGAGLSSTGEAELDALLPLPEPYEIPRATIDAIKACRGRVIAFGTTVARALEASFESGEASGIATLRLGPERPARVIDGLLTGFHDPASSHYQLECGLVSEGRLREAFRQGLEHGFTGHEFGDVALLFRGAPANV